MIEAAKSMRLFFKFPHTIHLHYMYLLLPSCVWHSDKVKQTLEQKAFMMIVILLMPFLDNLLAGDGFQI